MNPPEQPVVPTLPKPYPGFAQSLWVLLLFFLFSSVLMLPAFALSQLQHPQAAGWARLAAQFGALALTLVACLGKTTAWRAALPNRPVPLAIWPLSLLTTAGLILLTNGLDTWVTRQFPPPPAFLQGLADMGWPCIVLGAPFTEEILMRGLILGGFTLRYGPRKAILYSALLFGITHMNVWQFPGAVLIGLLVGWLTLRTGSLWPAVLAHLLNNLTVTLSRAFQIPYLWDGRFQPLWMWGLGLLLLGSGLAALNRLTREPAPDSTPQTAGL